MVKNRFAGREKPRLRKPPLDILYTKQTKLSLAQAEQQEIIFAHIPPANARVSLVAAWANLFHLQPRH